MKVQACNSKSFHTSLSKGQRLYIEQMHFPPYISRYQFHLVGYVPRQFFHIPCGGRTLFGRAPSRPHGSSGGTADADFDTQTQSAQHANASRGLQLALASAQRGHKILGKEEGASLWRQRSFLRIIRRIRLHPLQDCVGLP